MSQITDLIDKVAFRDEIAQATEIKGVVERTMNTQFNGFDFLSDNNQDQDLDQEQNRSQDFARPIFTPPVNNEPLEQQEPYDAEKAATSLVTTMTSFDTLLLIGGVNLKCRKNAGGSEGLKKMRKVLTKEIAGQELTEHDRVLLAKFKEYKENLTLLSKEIIPGEDEIQRLIAAAIPYCEETQMKIGSGFAFWTAYGGSLIARASKLLQ